MIYEYIVYHNCIYVLDMVRICDDMRRLIVVKIQSKMTQSEVARQLNIGQTTVRKIWKRYLETGSTNDRIRSGRPIKGIERERRKLCRVSKKDPFLTAREILIESNIDTALSVRTVQRCLQSNGLFGRIAAKKPFLNKVHIRKRFRWCKAYSILSISDWKNIIFSDESRIEIFALRRKYVRRPQGTRLQNRYICKTVKYSKVAVIIWGAIKGDGSRSLVRCDPRLNLIGYQYVLNEGLFWDFDSACTFMQDCAPCHTGKVTLRYLEQNRICLLSDWPP